MKKLLLLLILLTALVSLFSCAAQSDVTTSALNSESVALTTALPPTAEPTVSSTKPTAEKPPVTKIGITLEDKPLSAYTIVYADSLYSPSVLEAFSTEHDFFKLIAEDIKARIAEKTGAVLSVVRDSESDPAMYEILVGPTNREESDALDTMDVFKTCVKLVGTKLVVGAGYVSTPYTGNKRESYCYASTYHAWDSVERALVERMAAGIDSFTFDANTDFSTKVDLITVACIGDSITEGAGSTARDFHAYPAVLGRILWQDYLIVNLGNSGKTMRDDLASHYRGTVPHAAMRRYAPMYDYALLMLGTNDSYYDRSWPASSDEKFLSSAERLVEELTFNNDRVEVVVMNCPMYYGTSGSGSEKVRTLQALLPARFEAMGVKSRFFDMYTFTKEEVGKANFPDQLHPNDRGHILMAEKLSTLLTAWEDESMS